MRSIISIGIILLMIVASCIHAIQRATYSNHNSPSVNTPQSQQYNPLAPRRVDPPPQRVDPPSSPPIKQWIDQPRTPPTREEEEQLERTRRQVEAIYNNVYDYRKDPRFFPQNK